MGKSKLTQAQLFILFLLKDDLAAQLKRLNLLRNVVKVDSCCTFLEKFSALHPYLVEFFHVSRLVLQLVDTVLLARFVLLCHNYLLKADSLTNFEIKNLLTKIAIWLHKIYRFSL